MEKIKLIQPLWNAKVNDVLEVSKIRAEWAISRGRAVKYTEKKAEKGADKNKAEGAAEKNK